MFGIRHLSVDDFLDGWDHAVEILVEIQRTLMKTKNGTYFKTNDIQQVPNSFI